MAISRARTAILVSRDDTRTLAQRPCDHPPGKQNLKELLKLFAYDVRMYSELDVNEVGKENFLDDCELVVFDLVHAQPQSLGFIPYAIQKGLPCLLIGEPEPFCNPMLEIMSDDILCKGLFPVGLYWFSCSESLFAALTTLNRFKPAIDVWRRKLKSIWKDYPMDMLDRMMAVKIDNIMGNGTNVN